MTSSNDRDIALVSRLEAVPTILKVITETTGLRLALVAKVTQGSWTACAVRDLMDFGLTVGAELDVATTLCSEVRGSLQPIVIDHASQDLRYCDHRTPKLYGFESYISVPIFRKNGEYFGNVCALDARPAQLTERKTLEMFKLFAELIALQMEAEERQEVTRAALQDEQHTAELREQFIAVLGHDLRTPVSSIRLGADMLDRGALDPAEKKIVRRIQESSRRITRLLEDVMDFARGRLGAGIPMDLREVNDLGRMLQHVTEELRATHPSRTIHFTEDDCGTLRCDRQRIAQLVSNLIANALTHGDPVAPVEVLVRGDSEKVVLSVTNQGKPISTGLITQLFKPFVRRAADHLPQGLGLGLFIVDQISRSHGGTVQVRSTEQETTFTCTLPRR
ncbi:GAF domain-containing sensor histidine kinase [Hyalangium rubrum]|uniref:histidine kinase n=1 Tax=Hyalangium rubrum TaxID=3103134 RepID=A0ABU5HDH9_9BACT|nr:GAF domain-containing sensor histidine kinase [Hyalangium sp. s54d21]MDY7231514.1 GAF domain-containing sensor histidine kinase [Hyalangium sp. s54d21]